MKQIDKYSKKFKKYVEIFIIIMNLSCSHKIRKTLKIEKKKIIAKNCAFSLTIEKIKIFQIDIYERLFLRFSI